MKLLMLLGILLGLTSCKTNEPIVDFCSIVDFERIHCFPVDESKPEYERLITESLGYILVSPDDFEKLANHHQDLHTEIDTCGY